MEEKAQIAPIGIAEAGDELQFPQREKLVVAIAIGQYGVGLCFIEKRQAQEVVPTDSVEVHRVEIELLELFLQFLATLFIEICIGKVGPTDIAFLGAKRYGKKKKKDKDGVFHRIGRFGIKSKSPTRKSGTFV